MIQLLGLIGAFFLSIQVIMPSKRYVYLFRKGWIWNIVHEKKLLGIIGGVMLLGAIIWTIILIFD